MYKTYNIKTILYYMTYCHIIGKKQMNTMYNYDNSCMKTIILYRNLPSVNPDE